MFHRHRSFILGLQVLALLAFLPLYQNCSFPLGKATLGPTPLARSSGPGNGDTYDGKPKEYTRRAPGYTCDGLFGEYAAAVLFPNYARITTREGAVCSSSFDVSIADLDFSPNTDVVFGYKDGIYTRVGSEIDLGNESFTEVWCQQHTEDNGGVLSDIVIQWTQNGGVATGFVYSKDVHGVSRQSSLTRYLGLSEVVYSSPEMSLRINTIETLLANGKYVGHYRDHTLGPLAQTVPVDCRLGGQFDSVAPRLIYPQSSTLLELGRPAASLVPISNRPVVSFSITPELPLGLTFDPSTGAIAGTPRTTGSRKVYQVAAKFKFSEVVAAIEIGVGKGMAVNSHSMEPDVSFADGECKTEKNACTLKAAIDQANGNPDLPVLISVPTGVFNFGAGALTVTGNIAIVSQQSMQTVFDGNGLDRIFNVSPGGFLELKGIKLINGRPKGSGGAIMAEGATLVIRDCAFENNFSDDQYSQGGAISATNNGVLVIMGSRFAFNRTHRSGGDLVGGGLYANSLKSVSISSTEFTGNESAFGGAMYIAGTDAPVYLDKLTVASNTASRAGGIYLRDGNALISNSAFTANSAHFYGGGFYGTLFWSIRIFQSEFVGNRSAHGGAIYSDGWFGSKFLIEEATIIGNRRTESYERSWPDIPAVALESRSFDIFLKNSVVKNAEFGLNCKTTFVDEYRGPGTRSVGGNVFDDRSCMPIDSDRIEPR